MLVLSRKVGEAIRIGKDVVITILRIEGNRVSVGIDAPIEVNITRSELPPRKDDEECQRSD